MTRSDSDGHCAVRARG